MMHVQVSGYPTLYFVKANDKKNPVSYDGERTKVQCVQRETFRLDLPTLTPLLPTRATCDM
jgi:hypothetical protein